MNGKATNKGLRSWKVPLNQSPLSTPKFQLYHTKHTEMKTVFCGGVGGRAPHQPSPWAVAQSQELRFMNNFLLWSWGHC